MEIYVWRAWIWRSYGLVFDKWKTDRPLGYIWMTLLTLLFLPEFIMLFIVFGMGLLIEYIKENSFEAKG